VIVIDVGCARWGNDYSVERLIEMYRPDVLIGYDPASKVAEAMPSAEVMLLGKTNVMLRREAAWIYDGQIGYREDGLNSWVTDDPEAPKVVCVDLARVIDELPAGPVVLKIDAEGAEYDLLEHLLARHVDVRLDRVLVEWHPVGDGKRRRAIEMSLACPVEQWRW
jgi:FkbM family methyltransferase